MKKWFKRGLFALVTLGIVALIGAAVFLLTFDPNAYKAKIEQLVYERYQRHLSIDGEIELSLFPRIGLSVADVSLSDRNSTEPFAAVDSARFAVAVWPLLWNRLVVDHVAVSGFKVWLTRDEQGAFNFIDLLQRTKANSITLQPQSARFPLINNAQAKNSPLIPDTDQTEFQIDIAGLELKEGQIHFADALTQTQMQLVDLEINTGRMTFGQSFDVIFKGLLRGNSPAADATLEGQMLLQLEPQLKRYIAQRINVSLIGQIGAYHATNATFRGNVELLTLTEDLRARQVEIITQGRWQDQSLTLNKTNLSLTVAQLNLKRNLDILNTNKLKLRASGFLPVEAGQAENKVELALDVPQFSMEPEKLQSEPVALSFRQTQGADLFGFNAHIKNMNGTLAQLNLDQVQWDIAGKNEQTAWKLDATAAAQWQQSNWHLQWRDMVANLRIDDNALEPNPAHAKLTGSGSWKYAQKNAEFNGIWQSANTHAQLNSTLIKDENWQLGLQIDAEQIDLNPWVFSKARRQNSQEQKGAKTKVATSTLVSYGEMLPRYVNWINLQTHLNLQAEQLNIANYHLQNIELTAEQKEAQIQMQHLEADLFQGKLSANGNWQAQNNVAQFKANLTQIDLFSLSQALQSPVAIEGQGNIVLDLTTQGPTRQAWLAGLEGGVELQAQNGTVRGWDFWQQLNTANEAVRNVFSGQIEPPVESFDAQQSTPFTKLAFKLQLNQGQAEVKELNWFAEVFNMQAEPHAYVDLANGQMDMDLRFNLKKDAIPTDEFLRAYADHPVYVRLSGLWYNPLYRFQWQRLKHPAVQEAIEHDLLGVLGRPDLGTLMRATEPKSTAPTMVEGAAKTLGNTLKDLLKK